MDLASNIKAVRRAKGITPTMMAKGLGIEATNYPKFENRGNQLTYSNLEKICVVLGITVVDLITWNGDDVTSQTKKQLSTLEVQEKIKELATARDIAQEYAESLKRKVYSIEASIHSMIRNIGEEAGLGTERLVEENELYTMIHTIYTDSELIEIYEIIRTRYPHMYTLIGDLLSRDVINASMDELRLFLKFNDKIIKINT